MNSEQKAFEAAIRELLRERSALLLSGEKRALELIRAAQGEVLQLLAAQPSDWQQWQLTQLQAQIEAIIGGATGQAATVATGTLNSAWQAGQDMLDAGLRTLGVSTGVLPLQDTRVLKAMRGFVDGRFRDVGSVASGKIDTAIAMVLMGGKTPHQAMQDVQQALGGESARRAQTIVRTEASRAFAVAANERLVQGAALVPGMRKQWRRSGKLHSRWTHDVVDGQVVDVGKPFKVPNPGGGSNSMQYPHDPAAPAEQVINCGCTCLPWMEGWDARDPGAKPYSETELARHPAKAALDRGAKKSGYRPEPLPNIDKAVFPGQKVSKYVLDPDHPVGGHKARVLKAALGFDLSNADDFVQAVRDALPTAVAQLHSGGVKYGYHGYTVDVMIETAKGREVVRTGWRIHHNDRQRIPQLTTAYVRDTRRKRK